MIEAADPPTATSVEALRLCEVVDRLHEGDRFDRPWTSFDAVAQGQRIGTRHDGAPVLASMAGRIVFPNTGARPGQEWFYLARPGDRFARALAR
jgi:hypothetical protein